MRAHQDEDQANGRERLLDAAQALFTASGFSDVSINEIAGAAGMTRSAPYYHFKNKEELYAAVLVRQISGFFDLTRERIEAADSFRGKLLVIVDVAMLAHGSSFGRSKEDFLAHVSPEIQNTVAAQLPAPGDVFLPVFQDGFDAGAFSRTTPAIALQIFFMMLIGYMETLSKRDDCSPGPFRLTAPDPAAFIDVFLLGI